MTKGAKYIIPKMKTKIFYVTYARRGTNVPEVTRFMAKNEADVRQIFSNQDWLDGCTILTITRQ